MRGHLERLAASAATGARAALAAAVCAAALVPPAGAAEGESPACRARAILEASCARCHGRDGIAARGVDVLDRDRLVAAGAVVPGDARSPLLRMVESGAMPLGGPPLAEGEREALREWVLAGAPGCGPAAEGPRRFLDEPAVLGRIASDLERAPHRARPFLRYLSFAHLYNSGVAEAELARYRAGLSKLLNGLSWRREIAVPAAVDAEATVVRIDLRDYGWTAETWRRVEASTPYTLGVAASGAITSATGSALPYVRADWLAAAASAPPLYYDLLGLPTTVAELERALGVDAARNLELEHGVLRAGVRESGVSQSNRVVERHETAFGAYWKSYDFRAGGGARDIFADPVRLTPDGGEMIFNLPNGLQGYFLADGHGRRVDAGPLEIVSDRNRPDDPVVRAGRSCIACHAAGMKPVSDDVRAAALGPGAVGFDRARALALYPPQDEVDRAIAEDAGRFRAASERAGAAAEAPEPVDALARRYQADLGLAAAAAELGLEPDELLARLRLQGSPVRLGLGQIAAPGGAVKRAVWEERFPEIARGLGVGAAAPRPAARGRAWPPAEAPRAELSRAPAEPSRAAAGPGGALRAGGRIFIRTKTRFFTPALLADALRKRPEFARWGFAVVRDRAAADLEILVDRPLFTYTYTFTVTSVATSAVVASGKLTAFDGNVAAPKIAKAFLAEVTAAGP